MQDIYTDDFVDLGSTPYHRFKTFKTDFADDIDSVYANRTPAALGLTGMGAASNLYSLVGNIASGVVPTAQLAGGALGAGGAALLGMRNPWSITTAGLVGGSLGSMFDTLRAIKKKKQLDEASNLADPNPRKPFPGASY